MLINFSKMHGLGNDFVVIDAINQTVQLNAEQIKQLADRHYGIGFDQLLLVKEAQSAADFRYVIYNADGSEVSQCGNGARCFALFVRQKGLTDKANIRVETGAGDLLLHVNDDHHVCVDMGEPIFAPSGIPLLFEQQKTTYSVNLSGNEIEFSALSMGNPHAVIQVADVTTADVITLGAQLENHSLFPERVNVGFSEIIDNRHIKLRVYERGSGETLACGSGACAAAVAGIQLGLVDSPVNVTLTGGDLNIEWLGEGHPVKMTGPANFVFDGMIEL